MLKKVFASVLLGGALAVLSPVAYSPVAEAGVISVDCGGAQWEVTIDDESVVMIGKNHAHVAIQRYCLDMGHPLANKAKISFNELCGEKFIMQQPKTFQYRSIDRHCSESGFTPDIVLCAAQTKTIKQLVSNRMGVAILPEFVTRMDLGFRQIPFDPPYIIQISLCWREQKVFSEADELFIRFMKKYIDTPEFHSKLRRE